MEIREVSNGRINTLGQDAFGPMNGMLHPAGKYVGRDNNRIYPIVE